MSAASADTLIPMEAGPADPLFPLNQAATLHHNPFQSKLFQLHLYILNPVL